MVLKNYIALLAASTLALHATAQSFSPRYAGAQSALHAGRTPLVKHLLREQFDAETVAAKTTALTQRMVAASSNYVSAGIMDSMRYYYSTQARGAAHNPKNPASYDSYYAPLSIGYIAEDGSLGVRTLYMMPDSAVQFGQASDSRQRFTYNASNRVTALESTYLGSVQRYDLLYNSVGDNHRVDLLIDTTSSPLTTLLVPFYGQHSTYDAQHRVVVDSINEFFTGTAQPHERYQWTYNAAGRVTSVTHQFWNGTAGWSNAARSVASYLSNGLLQKVVSEVWDSSAWMTQYMDSFGYNGNNPSYTYASTALYNSDSGRLFTDFYGIFHLNAAGNWDSVRSYQFDGLSGTYTNDYLSVITYNAYQNWQSVVGYSDDDGNGIPDPQPDYSTNYYYELYDPASVADAAPAASFSMSPNPTSGTLNIRWDESIVPARYTLTDLNGRIVSTEQIKPAARHAEVSLSNCASGIYLLSISGSDGTVLHRGKVVRD